MPVLDTIQAQHQCHVAFERFPELLLKLLRRRHGFPEAPKTNGALRCPWDRPFGQPDVPFVDKPRALAVFADSALPAREVAEIPPSVPMKQQTQQLHC
jgi:hypothetical protein